LSKASRFLPRIALLTARRRPGFDVRRSAFENAKTCLTSTAVPAGEMYGLFFVLFCVHPFIFSTIMFGTIVVLLGSGRRHWDYPDGPDEAAKPRVDENYELR